MRDADRHLLDWAVEICCAAGALTLEWFQAESLTVDRKGDGTPVTEADRVAERFLRDQIAARFPDDAIVGEEEGAGTGTSGRTWTIDPIDGTKAFTHRVPLYSNLLALDDEAGPLLGVINLPALGETVAAGRGLGCRCNEAAARVSTTASLDGAYVSTCGWDAWNDGDLLALKASGAQLRTWGDGYGYALVATGRIDAMIDPMVAVWDLAPMPVIMAEAGGRFTAWDGNPSPAAGSGLATNGLLHDELLAMLGPDVAAVT